MMSIETKIKYDRSMQEYCQKQLEKLEVKNDANLTVVFQKLKKFFEDRGRAAEAEVEASPNIIRRPFDFIKSFIEDQTEKLGREVQDTLRSILPTRWSNSWATRTRGALLAGMLMSFIAFIVLLAPSAFLLMQYMLFFGEKTAAGGMSFSLLTKTSTWLVLFLPASIAALSTFVMTYDMYKKIKQEPSISELKEILIMEEQSNQYNLDKDFEFNKCGLSHNFFEYPVRAVLEESEKKEEKEFSYSFSCDSLSLIQNKKLPHDSTKKIKACKTDIPEALLEAARRSDLNKSDILRLCRYLRENEKESQPNGGYEGSSFERFINNNSELKLALENNNTNKKDGIDKKEERWEKNLKDLHVSDIKLISVSNNKKSEEKTDENNDKQEENELTRRQPGINPNNKD